MILDLNLIKDLKKEYVKEYLKEKVELDEKDFIEKFLAISDLLDFKWFMTEINEFSVRDVCVMLLSNIINNPDITCTGTGGIYLIPTWIDEEEELLEVDFLIKP